MDAYLIQQTIFSLNIDVCQMIEIHSADIIPTYIYD